MSEVGTDDKYFIAKQTEMMEKREEKQWRADWGWTNGVAGDRRGGRTGDVREQKSVTEVPK